MKFAYRHGMSPSPSWKPDEDTEECYCCRGLFTFAIRRHHCRLCGNVVCNSCSRHRQIVNTNQAAARICNSCHTYLWIRRSGEEVDNLIKIINECLANYDSKWSVIYTLLDARQRILKKIQNNPDNSEVKIEVLLPKSMIMGNNNNDDGSDNNENKMEESKYDDENETMKRQLTLNEIDLLLEFERCKDNQIFFVCVPPRHNPRLSQWTRRILLVTKDGRIYVTSPLNKHYTLKSYLETSDKKNDQLMFGTSNDKNDSNKHDESPNGSNDGLSDNEIDNIMNDIDDCSMENGDNNNNDNNSITENVSLPTLRKLSSNTPQERMVKRTQSPRSTSIVPTNANVNAIASNDSLLLSPSYMNAINNNTNNSNGNSSGNNGSNKGVENDGKMMPASFRVYQDRMQNESQKENKNGGSYPNRAPRLRNAYSMDWNMHIKTSPNGSQLNDNGNGKSKNAILSNSFYSATILKPIERIEPICFQFYFTMTRFEETFSKITNIHPQFTHIPQFSEQTQLVSLAFVKRDFKHPIPELAVRPPIVVSKSASILRVDKAAKPVTPSDSQLQSKTHTQLAIGNGTNSEINENKNDDMAEASQSQSSLASGWSMLANNDNNNNNNSLTRKDDSAKVAKSQMVVRSPTGVQQTPIPLNHLDCIPFACQFHPSRVKNLVRYFRVYNNFLYNKRNLSQPSSMMNDIVHEFAVKSPSKSNHNRPKVPAPHAPVLSPNNSHHCQSDNGNKSPHSPITPQSPYSTKSNHSNKNLNIMTNIANAIIAESPSMSPDSPDIPVHDFGIDLDHAPPKREKINLPKPQYDDDNNLILHSSMNSNNTPIGNMDDITIGDTSMDSNLASPRQRNSSLTPIPLPGPPRKGGSIASDDGSVHNGNNHNNKRKGSNHSYNHRNQSSRESLHSIQSNESDDENEKMNHRPKEAARPNSNNNNETIRKKPNPPNHRPKPKPKGKGKPKRPPPPAPIPLSKSRTMPNENNEQNEKDENNSGLTLESFFLPFSEKRTNKNANNGPRRSKTEWNLDGQGIGNNTNNKNNNDSQNHKRQASDNVFRRYMRSFFTGKAENNDINSNNSNKNMNNVNNVKNETKVENTAAAYWNSAVNGINEMFNFSQTGNVNNNNNNVNSNVNGSNNMKALNDTNKIVIKTEIATHPQHNMFDTDDWRCLSVVGFDACQDLFDVFASHRHKFLQKYLKQCKYYHFLIESMNTAVSWQDSKHIEKLHRVWQKYVIHCPAYKERYGIFDASKDNNDHFPNGNHDLWKEIGFQASDPTTDFRGMGECALDCLVYFGEHYSSHCEMIFSKHRHEDNYYPLCASFVNIAAMIADLTNARKAVETDEIHQTKLFKLMALECKYECEYDLTNNKKRAKQTDYTFNQSFYEIFCVLIRIFDAVWRSTKSNYFDFPQLADAFKKRIEYFLDKEPISLSVLLEWIESDTYIHEYKEVSLDNLDTIDVNLISTLKAQTKYS